ncbi:hypothetical protein BKA69DRAFT_1047610 [Paraphysoderma sedebokerense]|nr:hypothetical protein BKA69DRAFT_1047610 [Paraphysoderma sedebokerense]
MSSSSSSSSSSSTSTSKSSTSTSPDILPTLSQFCKIEASESIKCLEVNNYDKSMCSKMFQDYKDCKKLWQQKRKSRNRY